MTTVYSGRVTNWPLVWAMNVLAVLLLGSAVIPDVTAVPVVLAAVLILLANATMTSVRTTAGPNGVVVRYGVLGLPRFRYLPASIEHADAIDVPVRSMGGWGIHFSPWRGTRLTIRSGPSLQLHMRDGRPVTISADDPQAAAAVINAG